MRKQIRGFTLVELLVVVGVIAVLISLLLPTLNRARQQALEVQCMSNMRQLVIAVDLYANENGGQMPYCNWQYDGTGPNDDKSYNFGWLYSTEIRRGGYPAGSDLNGVWPGYPNSTPLDGAMTGVLWPYLRSRAVYHCPADLPDYWRGTEWMTSFLMNGAECGFNNAPTNPLRYCTQIPGVKMSQFIHPAACVLYWEALEQPYEGQSLTGSVWNDGSSNPREEVLADRHYKGANVAFVDGHAEWWDPQTWQVQANPPNNDRTELWCSPLSTNGH